MWRQTYKNHLPGLTCAIAFATMLLLGSFSGHGQTLKPPPDGRPSRADKDDLGSDIGSHEREMRAKLALSRDKKLYDENLARARETSEIASQLLESYQARKSFNGEDYK